MKNTILLCLAFSPILGTAVCAFVDEPKRLLISVRATAVLLSLSAVATYMFGLWSIAVPLLIVAYVLFYKSKVIANYLNKAKREILDG